MENLTYLFAAFALAWLLVFYYLFRISRRQIQLLDEVERVKKLVESQTGSS